MPTPTTIIVIPPKMYHLLSEEYFSPISFIKRYAKVFVSFIPQMRNAIPKAKRRSPSVRTPAVIENLAVKISVSSMRSRMSRVSIATKQDSCKVHCNLSKINDGNDITI